MNIKEFVKKRALDIVLLVIVCTLFFISGKKETSAPVSPISPVSTVLDEKISEPTSDGHISEPARSPQSLSQKPLPLPTPQFGNSPLPQADQEGSPQRAPVVHMTPNPNPYQGLKDSFKQAEGGAITTEAIIERNTYFRKLSEQLRDLQGEVSSESTTPPSNTNEVILSDEFPDQQNTGAAPLADDPEMFDEILDEMELIQ